MEPSHHFVAAQGYFELGMLADAWERLAELPEEERVHPRTLRLKAQLHIAASDFAQALSICRQLCDVAPGDPAGYIHGAYCLHELGDTEEARELLLSGPETLREEPIFFYNLGCYEARLGETDAACAWLLRSFQMNAALRQHARTDPDLMEIWESIRDVVAD
ncbi:MAG: tetratricopeptide repeat protein [Verrucomicrobiae bacterium]|nr:tetratricopeptide repeat protein [Verrucomicrobiae bacterium]